MISSDKENVFCFKKNKNPKNNTIIIQNFPCKKDGFCINCIKLAAENNNKSGLRFFLQLNVKIPYLV